MYPILSRLPSTLHLNASAIMFIVWFYDQELHHLSPLFALANTFWALWLWVVPMHLNVMVWVAAGGFTSGSESDLLIKYGLFCSSESTSQDDSKTWLTSLSSSFSCRTHSHTMNTPDRMLNPDVLTRMEKSSSYDKINNYSTSNLHNSSILDHHPCWVGSDK